MATSSLLSAIAYTVQGQMSSPETRKSPQYLFNISTSSCKQPVQCNAVSSAACMTKMRLLSCGNQLKLAIAERSSQGKGVCCSAMDVDILRVSFLPGKKFQLDDVIEAQQFDRRTLSAIFEVARDMEKVEKNSTRSQILKGYLVATLFYEPSTRTRLSFESAMRRLGGEVLATENARVLISGERRNPGKTMKDIIVMPHFESGAVRRVVTTAGIPVINAGNGPGQHLTQALLDVYTIKREVGKLDGIIVALVGDLANGRTVGSLEYLLAKYQGVKIYFISPDVVKMKDDIKEYWTSKGVEWEESADPMEVASKCDVVYQTRVQRERFGERIDLYEEARGKSIVDQDVLNAMQKHAVVMHPFPRLGEIMVDVDDDPRAAYFRQAKERFVHEDGSIEAFACRLVKREHLIIQQFCYRRANG